MGPKPGGPEVDRRAREFVGPEPASDPLPSFEHRNRATGFVEESRGVEAADPRADHNDVDRFDRFDVSHATYNASAARLFRPKALARRGFRHADHE